MSVKTVRFNKDEEGMLKKVLSHYSMDFSSCIKELLAEKLEDLKDIETINIIKEGKNKDYHSASDLDGLFDKKAS